MPCVDSSEKAVKSTWSVEQDYVMKLDKFQFCEERCTSNSVKMTIITDLQWFDI